MSLSKNDADILEAIVQLDGKCMDSQRCKLCPFRGMCIPEFIYPNPPTQQQRQQMALNVLAHHALVDEEPLEAEEYRWDKK
jgi:hypothetical protein